MAMMTAATDEMQKCNVLEFILLLILFPGLTTQFNCTPSKIRTWMTTFTSLFKNNTSISLNTISKRFYRNFTNSPSSKPGFMLFENVQKLVAKKIDIVDKKPATFILSEGLNGLFDQCNKNNKSRPSLKGRIHSSEIGIIQVPFTCN